MSSASGHPELARDLGLTYRPCCDAAGDPRSEAEIPRLRSFLAPLRMTSPGWVKRSSLDQGGTTYCGRRAGSTTTCCAFSLLSWAFDPACHEAGSKGQVLTKWAQHIVAGGHIPPLPVVPSRFCFWLLTQPVITPSSVSPCLRGEAHLRRRQRFAASPAPGTGVRFYISGISGSTSFASCSSDSCHPR
jgi:hypothetical protein